MPAANPVPPGAAFATPLAAADAGRQRLAAGFAVVAGAALWLWPLTSGPMNAMWPDLFAYAMGLVLLVAIPLAGRRAPAVIAMGWLCGAMASVPLALMQYFDLEDPFFPLIARTKVGLAYANLLQPNHLASLLAVGLLVLLWRQRSGRPLGQTLALALPLVFGLAASASRTGVLHLVLITLLAFWWGDRAQRRQTQAFVATMLGGYLVAAVVLPWALQFLLGVEGRNLVGRMGVEASCSSRILLWRNMLELVQARPWLGWGWGELGYAQYWTLFESPRFCVLINNAHNLPLHLAVELGLPIAVLLCGALATLVLRARPWTESDALRQLGWGVLGVIAVHSMVEFPLWFARNQLATLLAIGLVMRWPEARLAAVRLWTVRGLPAAAALLGWMAIAYVAFDYHRVSQLYTPVAERARAYTENTFEQASRTWLFRNQVLFAQVVVTEVDPQNGEAMLAAARRVLHHSAEPRIIEKVILSAAVVGRMDLVREHMRRYEASWPAEYAAWRAAHTKPVTAQPEVPGETKAVR